MLGAEEIEEMVSHSIICPVCGETLSCGECPVIIERNMFEQRIKKVEDEAFEIREALLNWNPGVEQFLISVVDEKDAYTHAHSQRVTELSLLIGGIIGLAAKDLSVLKKAAKLHDIGKLTVPEHILKKPGKLTEEEYERVKQHATKGAVFLSNMAFYKEVAEIIHSHHERWDGKGYPRGLTGENIPLMARIISVADTIDAMSLSRVYREGRGRLEILEELKKEAGKQFDPQIVWAVVQAQIDLR